jgi:gliding motility-associated-like protein
LRYTFPEKEITLTARDIGDSVLWNPPLFLSSSVVPNPLFRANNLGTYGYTVRIESDAGCVTTDTQFVKIIAKVEVFIPNAFTPNNDGLNDLLQPITLGIDQVLSFRIFNRYGQEVFVWSPQRNGWNGMFKNIPQDPGTYIWQFKGTGVDGELYTQKGFVILVR